MSLFFKIGKGGGIGGLVRRLFLFWGGVGIAISCMCELHGGDELGSLMQGVLEGFVIIILGLLSFA